MTGSAVVTVPNAAAKRDRIFREQAPERSLGGATVGEAGRHGAADQLIARNGARIAGTRYRLNAVRVDIGRERECLAGVEIREIDGQDIEPAIARLRERIHRGIARNDQPSKPGPAVGRKWARRCIAARSGRIEHHVG